MAVKAKVGSAGLLKKEPVHHKTSQGNGRGSRVPSNRTRKLRRGQGKR